MCTHIRIPRRYDLECALCRRAKAPLTQSQMVEEVREDLRLLADFAEKIVARAPESVRRYFPQDAETVLTDVGGGWWRGHRAMWSDEREHDAIAAQFWAAVGTIEEAPHEGFRFRMVENRSYDTVANGWVRSFRGAARWATPDGQVFECRGFGPRGNAAVIFEQGGVTPWTPFGAAR